MSGENQNFVPLYRKVLKNKIFLYDPTAWRVFEGLLLSCDYKTGVWEGGREQLGSIVNVRGVTAYKALTRLKNAGMVTTKSHKNYTTINILNWGSYSRQKIEFGNNARARSGRDQGEFGDTLTRNTRKQEIRNINKGSSNDDLKKLFFELVHLLGYSDKVKFLDNRRVKLKARLKTYPAEDIKQAASNIQADDFMQENKYGDIDYLLRNDQNIDKWLNKSKKDKTIHDVDINDGNWRPAL